MTYRLTGVDSGPYYFRVNETTGLITLANSVRNDITRFRYTVRNLV